MPDKSTVSIAISLVCFGILALTFTGGLLGTGVGTATAANPCVAPSEDIHDPQITESVNPTTYEELPPELRESLSAAECPAILSSNDSAALAEDKEFVNVTVVGGADGIGGTEVTVRAETPEGQPVENASVYVNGEFRGHTNADGTYTVTHDGNHVFVVVSHGDAHGSVLINPRAT